MALFVVAGTACAPTTFVDYDKAYDFDSIQTFKWAKSEDTSLAKENPLMHSRIVNAIEHYLGSGGLQEVDADPDIYVTYHTSTQQNLSVNTSSYGYGYPGGWYGGYYGHYGYGAGLSTSSTSVTTYETGTLLVDARDPKTKDLVWRGTSTEIMISNNPDKMAKRIDKALGKIVYQWQKIKAKDAQ